MVIQKSITRLLAERKALEPRIGKATAVDFIGIQKGTTANADVLGMSGKTVAEAKVAYKANLDRVEGLIAYHKRITAAIVASNAVTEVTIGTEKMVVAVAIERKSSIKFEQALLATILNQAKHAQTNVATANLVIEDRIDKQMTSVYGADKTKVTGAARTEVAGPIEAAGKQSVIDAIGIAEWAQAKMDALSKFVTEVDFVLSESNARTILELEDETVG